MKVMDRKVVEQFLKTKKGKEKQVNKKNNIDYI
jgi:hypothetical protein